MKKVLYRAMSILIVITLVISVCSVNVCAATGVSDRLNALRTKFPDGKYWNHHAISSHNNNGPYQTCTASSCMNPDLCTSVPCTSHNSAVGVGGYDCNNFDGGIQCWGFANKVFYDVFGVYASKTPNRTDVNNVAVGDWIRVNNDTHSAIVLSRDGNYITIVEGNYDNHCLIKWDRRISISTINYFKHASNYDDVNGTHRHEYASSTITKQATCTEDGIRTLTCSCGDTKTEMIKATGHSEEKDAPVAATCTKSGLTQGSHCETCRSVLKKQEVIPALGHDFVLVNAYPACDEITADFECLKCKTTKREMSVDYIWSNWSEVYPTGISIDKIETKTVYRSVAKITKTSTASSMEGWTCIEKNYSDYGSWSGYSLTSVSEDELTDVRTATLYCWYAFVCPNCGTHDPFTGACSNCNYTLTLGHCVTVWDTTPFSSGSPSVTDGPYHKTKYNFVEYGKLYSAMDHEPQTGYSYRKRSIESYVFEGWGDYSSWQEKPIAQSETVKTESTTGYRYKITTTAHNTETYWNFNVYQHWKDCKNCENKVHLGSHEFDNAADKTCNVCGYIRDISVVQFGDANGDNIIDTADLVHMKKLLAGLLDGAACSAGVDANGDGTVDTGDLLVLKKYLAGLIDTLGTA